ncbi:RHS repeat domain-containing protein [Aliikangiella coralliicola]|nr:RHS repeat-associated core domain-containing protein [Aliikangiella coralliicola]
MCLDGKPLATVVQNPQAMRFRLRGDSFSAIKPLANGGYQLTQPDGTVLEYGTSDDSYLITKDPMDLDVVTSRIRKIKRKTDVFGNQVVYHYHKNQEIQNSYPTAIDYGEGDNLVSIKMNYMSRSYTELVNDDPTHVVIPGGQEDPFLSYEVQNTPLLKGVEIWRNGIKIREYHLASKETDTTDVYWLDQLQECGFGENGGNESCLEPLKFKWDFRDGPAKGAITSVTSKYGLTTEFDYLTMQEGSTVGQFNERPFGEFNAAGVGHVSDLTAEEEDEGKLKTVVTAIRKSDGLGGLNEKQVSYQGVGLTTEAHDFVGFEAMKIYDVVSNTTRYTQFETAGTAFGLQNQVNARSETYLGTNNSGELLSQVFNRYLYFSMDHGEYHQDGHGEKRMLTYLYLNTAQTVYSYQDGQLISVKQTRKTPELDTNLRLLKSMTTETEWASSSNKTSEGKAGDTWSVSDHLLSGVIRKQKVKKQFTNYTNDEWIIGFNHQTDSDWFEGSSTVPYQSVKETQEAYVHNGAYTHRIDNKTSFSGDADLSLSSSFTYDSLGRLLTTTASGVEVASRTSSIDAFEFGGNPAQTTNALSQTASAKYDLRFDSVKETTDINNLVSTIGFDQFGRISTQTNPDNVTVSTTYESCDGVCSRVNGPSGHGGADALIKITRSSPVTSDVVSYFDVFEREIRSETISFDGKAVYRDRLYNKRGQLAYESLPYFSDSTPSWIHYEYDAYGRLAKVNRPDNSSTQTTYSVVGGLPATTVTQHVTDADKAHTDTHRKQTIQNRTGEVYQVHDAYGSSDQVTTEFAYYPTGLSKWIKVAGNEVASFSFDVAGNRITLVDQNLGTVTSKYNGLGELLWEEDNAGLRADYKYDLLGRQTRETTLDGVQNWVYDTSANGKGLLDYTEFVDNDSRFYHKQDLSYYNDSKLSGTKVDIKVPGYTKSYTSGVSYDSYGRLKTTTYPGGVSATNHFNSRGFLEKVLDENGGQLQKVVSVDAFGNITSEEFGPSISTAKAFEPLTGSLRSLSSTRASNQIQNESYRWLSNGMLEKREDARINVSETFDYDPLGRLTDSYTYQSSASSPSRQLSQSYDIYGNIKTKTTVIGEGDDLTDYVYDTSASISGNGGANAVNSVYLNGVNRTLVYNANGAIRQYLSSDGDNRYLDWTARGKPHRVSRGPSESNFNARDEFAYGIDGARYYRKAQWKDTNGQLKNEHTFYVGAYEEVLTEADNEYSALYKTQLGNAIKIKGVKHDGYTITNNTEYLLRDHLGSVAAIVDQNGDIMRLAYEPFGNRRKDNWLGKFNSDELGTLNNNLRRKVSRGYTGHEHLDRTGLIHMNGRVYDPTLGRFLSPDPIVQAPHFSQSYNRYSYVFNNPMRFVDPSGYKTTIRGSDSGGSVCFCSTTFYGGSRKAIASAAAAVLPPDADYLAPVIADYATTGGFSTTFHFNNESVTTYHRMSNRTKNYGSEIADIREGFGGGISQREGFSNAQKDSIGALIQNMGQSSGLLDSNFEIELYQKWWYGDGSNYELEKITFNEILSVGIIKYKEAKSVPLSDGTQGFSAPIDTYGSPKYNYGIGEATVYLNANMKPVGFIDFYNFDQGNRAFIAERVTRSVGEFGKIYNANDYYIYYGVLGP